MILFIIFATMLVMGICLIIAGVIIDNRSSSNVGFELKGFAAIILFCAVLGITATGGLAMKTRIRRNLEYEQRLLQYEMITAKLEEDSDNYFLLYGDISDYNNAILEDRYWADNLWVNWYHNGLIKDLPLIGEQTKKTNSLTTAEFSTTLDKNK